MKEYRAHTICQCCGQPIVLPNIAIIEFPEKLESAAMRMETIANVHGMNVALRKLKKGKHRVIPLMTDEKSQRKVAVISYMLDNLVKLQVNYEKQNRRA